MTLTDDIERMHDRTTNLTVPRTFADGRTNILKIGRVTEPRQTQNTRTLKMHVLWNALDANRCGLQPKQNIRQNRTTQGK